MKTKLLFILLLISALGYSQTYDHTKYFISEIIPSPPNNSGVFNDLTSPLLGADYEYAVDDCIEYFEFRGTPNAVIESDVYFIVIDGDGDDSDIGSNIGKVREGVDISGLTFGSNGILVIVANMTFDTGSLDQDGTTDISGTTLTNPYATELATSGANVVNIELTGTPAWVGSELDKFNGVSKSPDIGYDGSINDQSATYMIVKSTAGNPKNEIVDAVDDMMNPNADGVLDGAALAWTIYDSVSILDDDDITTGNGEVGEFGYGKVIFVELLADTDPLLHYDSSISPTIVTLNQYPNYVARQGLSTGFACTTDAVNNDDWMAGRVNSRSYPDWKFSSTGTRNIPSAELTGENLSDFSGMTYGEVNVNFNPLSVGEEAISKLRLYPNPTSDYINIEANNMEISEVALYNLLGKKVLSQTEISNNSINISNLSKGVYFIKISAKGNSIIKKIIKK
jgi:hypothetical protein